MWITPVHLQATSHGMKAEQLLRVIMILYLVPSAGGRQKYDALQADSNEAEVRLDFEKKAAWAPTRRQSNGTIKGRTQQNPTIVMASALLRLPPKPTPVGHTAPATW
jgi:hypothetical protein